MSTNRRSRFYEEDELSRETQRALSGMCALAIFDAVLIGAVIVILIYLCGGGMFVLDNNTYITLFHLGHVILLFSTCVACPLGPRGPYFLPIWFIWWTVIAAVGDVIAVVLRGINIFNGGFAFGCDLFLFFIDLLFLATAVLYLGYAARAAVTPEVGLFGVYGETGGEIHYDEDEELLRQQRKDEELLRQQKKDEFIVTPPELGIASSRRKNIKHKGDFDFS